MTAKQAAFKDMREMGFDTKVLKIKEINKLNKELGI